LFAGVVWLPALHLFYVPSRAEQDVAARALARPEVLSATTPPDLAQMRGTNPEWDFMRRTFAVLTLANRALEYADESEGDLGAIDAIVDETLDLDANRGDEHFMLPYGRARPFVDSGARSLFIDGEVVLMIAARELVAPRERSIRGERTRSEAS